MKMLNTLFCSGNFEKSLCEDVYDWVHYALTSKTVFVRILKKITILSCSANSVLPTYGGFWLGGSHIVCHMSCIDISLGHYGI